MRLLIVDDDVPTVETVWDSIAWRDIGITEVEIAHSVSQAKAVILRAPVDIVISDIEMPQASGLDLLAWIRGRGEETEFILLTCHERFDYAAHAIKLDAAEYLVKPFDAEIMQLSVTRFPRLDLTRSCRSRWRTILFWHSLGNRMGTRQNFARILRGRRSRWKASTRWEKLCFR